MLTRTVPAAALAVALSVAGAGVASAHVRVIPDGTASGSFTALTFRVPNESATASTTKVSVDLPQDTPFLYVSSKPVAGWEATMTEAPLPQPVETEGTTITKAVRTVTWTATEAAGRIDPGEYQEFSISVGPLPAAGAIELPATQTYSDGEVVRWDQPTPASGAEPERPAPALVVTAAATPAGGPTSSPSVDPTPTPAAASTSADPLARVLSGIALAVSVAGLAAAGLSLRRRRTAL